MPIKITNNSNIIIKHFCFYLFDDSKDIEQSCLMSELIFKEIEISNNKENKNNEKIIYVPLMPKKEGKILIKILFKFEEERTMIDYEIQRFIIILDVYDSFFFDIKENVHKFISDSILADLDVFFRLNTYNKNCSSLEKLIINPKLSFSNIYAQVNISNITNSENGFYEKNASIFQRFIIKKKIEKINNKEIKIHKSNEQKNKRAKEQLQNIKFDFLDEYDFINYDITQSHIKHYFCKLLLKEFLIFNWSAKEKNSKRNINGIFTYKPKLIFSLSLNSFINFIKNLISIKHTVRKMNDVTICNLDVSIDNNYYNQLENIKGIEIFINNNTYNFEKVKWFGLQKYKLSKINDNNQKENEIHFSCLISEKGIYDINQISILAHFYFSRNEKKIFNKILSPIIVKVD